MAEPPWSQYDQAFKRIWEKLDTLTKALESVSQDALLTKQQDIDVLLRTLLNSPLIRTSVDSAGRLRIVIDAAGTATPVTLSSVGNFPVDQRFEVIQRSNIEYGECQRNKFTFV
jgi:outer membrane receptor protein involved in Fe transport